MGRILISERKKFLSIIVCGAIHGFGEQKNKKKLIWLRNEMEKITGYEFKWNPDQKVKIPRLFLDSYETSDFQVIHRNNCDSFCSNIEGE